MSVTYSILTKVTSRCFNFGIYLLLLLSSAACSTIDLGKHGTAIFYSEKPIISPTFSKLPELPTDHDAILARVEGSFDSVMQFVRPYRMIAEPVDPSYPLKNVPSIYMFERVGTVYNDSPTFSSRLVEPEQEHIIVVTDECIGGWSNFGAGWESAPELHYAYNWLFVYFHNTFVQASPYRYFGPGIGLSFESTAIG